MAQPVQPPPRPARTVLAPAWAVLAVVGLVLLGVYTLTGFGVVTSDHAGGFLGGGLLACLAALLV